jgi:hypothetical protein
MGGMGSIFLISWFDSGIRSRSRSKKQINIAEVHSAVSIAVIVDMAERASGWAAEQPSLFLERV